MTLNTSGELWWGLTDILLCLFAIAMAILLHRKYSGKAKDVFSWQIIFIMFALASIFGVIVHTFEISNYVVLRLWVVLYLLLFEASKYFHAKIVFYLSNKKHPNDKEKKYIRIFEIIVFIITILLHFTLSDYTKALYVFIVYAAVLFIPMIYLTFFGPNKSLYMKLLLLALALSLLSQGFSEIIKIGVVLGHIFDMIALYLGYLIACDDLNNNVADKPAEDK